MSSTEGRRCGVARAADGGRASSPDSQNGKSGRHQGGNAEQDQQDEASAAGGGLRERSRYAAEVEKVRREDVDHRATVWLQEALGEVAVDGKASRVIRHKMVRNAHMATRARPGRCSGERYGDEVAMLCGALRVMAEVQRGDPSRRRFQCANASGNGDVSPRSRREAQ